MAATLKATPLRLPGLLLLEPTVHRDERGLLWETYRQSAYRTAGVECDFVQDNHSHSIRNTLRGLHCQLPPGQAKLVSVLVGEIYDVAVDVRPQSPTFGQWEGVKLSADAHQQLFLPAGFAHGFCVASPSADVLYKLSTPYDPATETGFRWDDPEVGIVWPVSEPLVSPRDREAQPFSALRERWGQPG